MVDQDEYIRAGATLEGMQKLRPPSRRGQRHRRNASGINDGAAAVVLMTAAEAEKRGLNAAGAHRLLVHLRRRPRHHGHGPDPGLAQGA